MKEIVKQQEQIVKFIEKIINETIFLTPMTEFKAVGTIVGTVARQLGREENPPHALKLKVRDSGEHLWQGAELVEIKGPELIEHLVKTFNISHSDLKKLKVEITFKK